MNLPFRYGSRKKLHQYLSATMLSCVIVLLICVVSGSLLVTPALATNYNRQYLEGVDFSGQDLTDSRFSKTNLRNSDLSYANLTGVSLFGANLERANLVGADLRYATLDSARLVKANLTNAVLEGAFASNVQFEGAIIEGADFTDVMLRSDIQDKLCAIAAGTNPVTGRQTYDTLFCP
ncbi:MAG: pentapeptide repeat-containing protein [Cyanothece sp. SIO1E1]|nr:pentapeptide repeat-containing protein [Cyanothece sp. SIO1E1]